MTLNIYNELYKNRESDYPFGFLSQREWEKLTEEEKKNTRRMVVESLPKKEQELILWHRDIYYPNFYEVLGNMARASHGKKWENSDNEEKKTLIGYMHEEFYNEPEHKLLSYIPSWQKIFNQEEQDRLFLLINGKWSFLKGFGGGKIKDEYQRELKNYLLRLKEYKEEARTNYHNSLLYNVINEDAEVKKRHQKEEKREKDFKEFWNNIFDNLDKEIRKEPFFR